ncbi:hypothetical protein FHG87_006791 [Trinorchestia longiramus]|nr:hypothetical protein FHG87_006791 [Trinorchestia longiramus]
MQSVNLLIGDLKNIGCQLRRRPGQSRKSIFTASGRPDVPKSTKNAILGTIASVSSSNSSSSSNNSSSNNSNNNSNNRRSNSRSNSNNSRSNRNNSK